MNDSRRDGEQRQDKGDQEIDRRFLDDQAEGEQEIVDAAADASDRDRQEPGSPERVERSFDVEDPSHSRGSTRRKS